jgi:Flp pilus assembly protein TadG
MVRGNLKEMLEALVYLLCVTSIFVMTPMGSRDRSNPSNHPRHRPRIAAGGAASTGGFAQCSWLFTRFWSDQSGSYAVIVALALPLLAGAAGLAVEAGMWFYKYQEMLSAADSSAVSAVTAGGNYTVEANAVAAMYGYVNGTNGTTVTVNQPPLSGSHMQTSGAVEVIVQQTQNPLFSALFGLHPVTIKARSVALPSGGSGCVLALDATAAGAVNFQGNASVTLGCGIYDDSSDAQAMTTGGSITAYSVNVVGGISGGTAGITTTKGVHTGVSVAADPYASVSLPSFSGCDYTYYTAQSTITMNPGVYCGGITFTSGATVTLRPGVYFLDQGSTVVRGGASITGSGVTVVFTSSIGSNWATMTINNNASINVSAPTSGSTAGLVFFGDRRMTTGTTFKLGGGNGQTFGGAIYLPKAAVTFTGNSTASGCTQIVADTITFTGSSNVQLNCSNFATKSFGSGGSGTLAE